MPDEGTPAERFSRFGARGDDEARKKLEAIAGPDTNAEVIAEMRHNRRVNSRTASSASSSSSYGGTELSFASGRPTDPLFYWKQNNLPWDPKKGEHLQKIREYCRLLYQHHPLIASAIDVYSKYPLTGMEFVCKDPALVDFYSTLFLDQLNYEEFLIDVGREYWTVGEAWPLGQFSELLGVWEDDELLDPDDVAVIRSPFSREPRFEIRLPEVLRNVIETRQPAWEFERLMKSYPELVNFSGRDARMPVSNILLKQMKFKGDTFNPRGVPILLRGFRAIIQEEMLNAAQDSIASRLYTPLILATLGASATDLGTQAPWIPTETDLANFTEALDAALAADFRVLVHHFATKMEPVFGRESMPDFTRDFERLDDRILQVFGLSKTMMSGASAGQTYAADALNRDLISQLLTTYQRMLKRFVRDRMLVVAEAQEHFDYEERGGKRYPIMEEVLEVDEETGEQRIVEQPKLLVPDLEIKAMTMKSEQDIREYQEALIEAGVPISIKTRMVNVPWEMDEEIERVREEAVAKAVANEETRLETYKALRDRGLPIPEDLRNDFEPKALQSQVEEEKAEEMPLPNIGVGDIGDTAAIAPSAEDMAMVDQDEQVAAGGQVIPLPTNKALADEEGRARPPESDEMRKGMPRASFRRVTTSTDDEGNEVEQVTWEDLPEDFHEGSNRLLSGPRHIGSRKHAKVDKDTPLDEDEAS